jgi:hypothetical protein
MSMLSHIYLFNVVQHFILILAPSALNGILIDEMPSVSHLCCILFSSSVLLDMAPNIQCYAQRSHIDLNATLDLLISLIIQKS